MRTVDKLLGGYAFCALAVFISMMYKIHTVRPDFLINNHQPIVHANGITFADGSYDAFKVLHTVKSHPLGYHKMSSLVTSVDDTEIFKMTYAVYFFNDVLFSAKIIEKDDNYTQEQEPDLTEAHMIEYPQEEHFQILFQDNELACYSSLLTDSVQCVKLII
ncbi:hypothetical protein [Vibrio sp. CAU 1672]|uniref:hypothetical protein n=1 Tax=Vibrio sp. CAU 1672 TaxID=3032594 RepID=UPI0023DC762D|nr:hypothetical protein [Vibrio sp. CAU 1672]MDF2152830.1 hypothetical protein [Vibrio sp. CAU 1672]